MTRREQLYPEIRRLREDEGLKWREIAERLGLAIQTAHEYYHDPASEGARARKAKQVRSCVDCGAPCNFDGSVTEPAVRCLACAPVATGAARKVWTRDSCAEAMRAWAAEHDGVYPTTLMWDPTRARALGGKPHPDYVNQPDRWPCWITVVREWGTWRACVVAAGFTPRERGQTLARLREAA